MPLNTFFQNTDTGSQPFQTQKNQENNRIDVFVSPIIQTLAY
jgi:hypothetical protein